MAGEGDAKARFPRQEVHEGQKHGYLGEVEVFDPEPAGSSNATAADLPTAKRGRTPTGGVIGQTTKDDVQGEA